MSCAVLMRMLCDHFIPFHSSMGSPGLDEVRWLQPVRPGDRIPASRELATQLGVHRTTVANAYVGPKLTVYLSALDRKLKGDGLRRAFYITASNGGVMTAETAIRHASASDGSPVSHMLVTDSLVGPLTCASGDDGATDFFEVVWVGAGGVFGGKFDVVDKALRQLHGGNGFFEHLLLRRLPHVHNRQPLEMAVGDLLQELERRHGQLAGQPAVAVHAVAQAVQHDHQPARTLVRSRNRFRIQHGGE